MTMSSQSYINKTAAKVMDHARNISRRGVVKMVNALAKMQGLQVSVLSGELSDSAEHAEAYGLTSHPLVGAEAFLTRIGGDSSHPVVLIVSDRRYRPTNLEAGEVCLYDHLKQRIHLTKDGIVIDGAGLPIVFKNTPSVTFDTPLTQSTGELTDRCQKDGQTLSGMRATYNRHTHPENNDTTTSKPNQAMGGGN